MPLFEPYDIERMNETDVREAIVRPLIRELGYAHGGAEARIETEKTFRYGKTFLGRKNPGKDPDLVGRADYICEVVSVGRWVVEVKSPRAELTLDDAEQAHTYTAHPEVAGSYFLLCNGHEFRLYRANSPAAPAALWPVPETENILPALRNYLSPAAIRKAAERPVDLAKPLAEGLGPSVDIVGGQITHERNTCSARVYAAEVAKMNGQRLPIVGGRFSREADGSIFGTVDALNNNSAIDQIEELLETKIGVYRTSDEYISRDVANPTIFQNAVTIRMPPGRPATGPFASQPLPGGRLPFGIDADAKTEATAYLEGDRVRGVFRIHFDIRFTGPAVAMLGLAGIPAAVEILSEGAFEIAIK